METPKTLSRLEIALAGVEPAQEMWVDLLVRILDCSRRTAQRLLADQTGNREALEKIALWCGIPVGVLVGQERFPLSIFGVRASMLIDGFAYRCYAVADRRIKSPPNGNCLVLRNLDEKWLVARVFDKVDGRPFFVSGVECLDAVPQPYQTLKVLAYTPDQAFAAELKDAFEVRGYQFELHTDAEAAIASGIGSPPDILLVDDAQVIAVSSRIDVPIRQAAKRTINLISTSPLATAHPLQIFSLAACSMGYYSCLRSAAAVLTAIAQISAISAPTLDQKSEVSYEQKAIH
ncbi:hypothetical protein [Chitinimonas lacunae]|uniref:Uncharacterized protein n=1 Tax=Chitinimonas lacunae TaxID=1963018 RepID=A0ABV8MVC8_9NEIS